MVAAKMPVFFLKFTFQSTLPQAHTCVDLSGQSCLLQGTPNLHMFERSPPNIQSEDSSEETIFSASDLKRNSFSLSWYCYVEYIRIMLREAPKGTKHQSMNWNRIVFDNLNF